MKYIKSLIAVILFSVIFLITGESVQPYLNTFQMEYMNTTFYLSVKGNATAQEMLDDIASVCEKNNIYPFVVSSKNTSMLNKEITVYADPNAQKHIKTNSHIVADTYNSLLIGNTTVRFLPFKAYANDISFEHAPDYYFIGDIENARSAKRELILYGGAFPHEGRQSSIYLTQLALWVLVLLILVFLTVYDVFLSRRENHVKIINGYSVKKIIVQNVLIDIGIYFFAFVVSQLLVSSLTFALFNIKTALLCFAVLLVTNTLFYIVSLPIILRAYLPSAAVPSKLLRGNYILNTVSLLITALIISGNVVVIGEAISFYNQKDYFQNYSEYEYLSFMGIYDEKVLGYTSTYNIALINEIYYRNNFNTLKPCGLVTLGFFDHENVLLANYHDYDMLTKHFPTLNKIKNPKGVYILIPEQRRDDTAFIPMLQANLKIVFDEGYALNPEFIYYDKSVRLVYTDESLENGSNIAKSPTVVFDARDFYTIPIPSNEDELTISSRLDYYHDLMFLSSDSTVRDVEKEFPGITIVRTNVYERYLNQWDRVKVILYINLLLSALSLVFQLVISNTVIRLEYAVNAKEHAINSVNGFSLWQTNYKIYLFNLAPLAVTIPILAGLYLITQSRLFAGMLGGCLALLALEAVVLTHQIYKQSNKALAKIFKGGIDI